MSPKKNGTPQHHGGSGRSKSEHINSKFSGCTGTMVAVDTKSKTLYSCNVGDSRIILGRGKQRTATVVELTLDHSPDAPKERERIEKSGGGGLLRWVSGRPDPPARASKGRLPSAQL